MISIKLPPEIWLVIFRLATNPDTFYDYFTTEYIPFQSPLITHDDSALSTKSALVLVCQEWKQLMTEFLYEDVYVSRGTDALRAVLEHHDEYRRLVRRVTLPYSSTATKHVKYLPSVDVIRLCSNLEILVRPQMAPHEPLQFHFEAEQLPVLPLRRLDWCHYSEADRSGGINSLNSVLQLSPKLQYLSIRGVLGPSRIRMDGPMYLPELRTLRLHESNALLLRVIMDKWCLPTLSHIVIDSPPRSVLESRDVWGSFGSQLRTIEFGKHVRFLTSDFLAHCLRDCPNLIEVNYFPFFTFPPDFEGPHTSIAAVGLHASVNRMFQDGESICTHIEQHFRVFSKTTLPALTRITLFGEWRGILSHPRLLPLWRKLSNEGIDVKRSDIARFR